MARYAVVLLNLGGPDSLDAVEPFLRNLLSDHDIFKIPFGQKFFANRIAKQRAPGVSARYRQIGGKSPINEWTTLQGRKLEEMFRQDDTDVKVYIGMRYWHPAIRDVAVAMSAAEVEKIVLLPLYPQYSITTTGSSFKEWQRSYTGSIDRLVYVDHYCDHEKYIAAINQRIDEAVLRFPEPVRNDIQIVFSAHGTPQRLEKQGDPYSRHIRRTVAAVMARRGGDLPYHLCFQSRIGPMKWLGPSIQKTLSSLASQGKRQVLVVPISFVCDHIETLFELGMEYREIAAHAGIEHYVVMEGLNDSDLFVSALKDVALQALKPAFV